MVLIAADHRCEGVDFRDADYLLSWGSAVRAAVTGVLIKLSLAWPLGLEMP
jgi:hypothetical protein